MANVLTDLAADIYRAADVVGRELVGVIPSATLNTDASQRVAQNDVIRSHFTRSATVGTVSPAMTIPEGTDQTVDTKTMTLGTTASVKIPWTGEDIKHVNNGAGFETIYGDQIRQAMRAIVNQIESQVAADVYKNAGNAYGTSATTPFGSNFNEVAEVRKLLMDRGMPDDGRASIVINTAAGVKLRNLASLQSVNTSGNDDLLRRGTLLDLQNMMIKESGNGDGDITLNSGLLAAVADGEDVAIQAAFTANIAFHQAAVEIGMRPMAQPNGGDAAVDRLTVQDPFSGLIFEIAAYKGYNKAMFDVSCLYGYKVWKPDFVCVLQG